MAGTLLPPAEAPRDGPIKRELAHRLFAQEFNSSRHQIPGAGEKDPSYVVSPLGAKVNRLHVVGVCTEVEQVGKSGEMWRARISDPTGVFTVMAGNYQPEASQVLSQLQVPCFLAVTGKARTYEPEPGSIFVSVRPETVAVADEQTRNQWVLDTARRTLERLHATELAREGLGAEAILQKDLPRPAAEGAVLAREVYGTGDLNPWREMARRCVGYLLPGGVVPVHQNAPLPSQAPAWTSAMPSGPLAPSASPTGPGSAPGASGSPALQAVQAAQQAAHDALDEQVLAAVQRLQGAKGAKWDEVLGACVKPDVTAEHVEESLNRLMDKGLVYEPTLGILKTT